MFGLSSSVVSGLCTRFLLKTSRVYCSKSQDKNLSEPTVRANSQSQENYNMVVPASLLLLIVYSQIHTAALVENNPNRCFCKNAILPIGADVCNNRGAANPVGVIETGVVLLNSLWNGA